MKIVVCGSMSLSRRMVEIERELREQGHEVVLPEFTCEYAAMASLDKVVTESARNKIDHDLIRRYFHKIREGDAVLIVNEDKNGVSGYIGGNSLLEMGFAYVLDKPIYILKPIPQMGYTDEIVAMQPIVLDGDLGNIRRD
ncbi:MAG: hypothetical protein ABIJ21_05090 [Nanoarchaeota archaeon]